MEIMKRINTNSDFEKNKFIQFIINNNVVGIFEDPIILKSGRESYWYVNWRDVSSDVYLIDKLSDFVIQFIKHIGLSPDCIFGVPEGATKLGILTQYKWAKRQKNYGKNRFILSMGRAKPKSHGDPKDRFYLGIPEGKVIILEDVTTTGGSLLNVIDQFLLLDLEIIAAIGLTNRDEVGDDGKTVKERIGEKGIEYYSMSHALEILPQVFKTLKIKESIIRNIEQYFSKYGEKEINLNEE